MGWADKGAVDEVKKLDCGQIVKGLECHVRKSGLYPEASGSSEAEE